MRRQIIVAAVQAILVPAFGLLLAGPPRAEEEPLDSEIEVVDMTPDEAPKLGVSHLTSGFGALFKGPGHYYTSHEISLKPYPKGLFSISFTFVQISRSASNKPKARFG